MGLTRRVREHALLSLIFLASRTALYLAGLRFNLALEWMWLGDPADLHDRLLQTLYYFHAFPPGMNLLTGLLLKLGGPHIAALALAVFWALGLLLANSLFYLCRVSGLSASAALLVAVFFSLLPQSIYFEHLYLYECPIAALLCLGAAFFYRAIGRQSFLTWFGFFVVCAAIGFVRTTFHLVWFLAMAGLGVWFTKGDGRPRVLVAALFPALLLLALYAKNLALFGVFDAFTFGPVSLNLATTWHLPADVRDSWVKEGKLSPFAAVSVYAGPREYLPWFGSSENPEWPPQMNQLERPSVHAGNYNHWFFLEVNRRRRADALYYVRARPFDYAANVLRGMRDIFQPTTEWHPLDKTDKSPHHEHRRLLGGYEVLYNNFVHGFPIPPVGLYVLLPLPCIWALRRARSLLRQESAEAMGRGALLYFCLFQIVFVVATSSLFTFRESARYRYQLEPMIWLITALSVASLWAKVRGLFAGTALGRNPSRLAGGERA